MKNLDLGKDKISKLLLNFSIPCIISMLVGALYNIVDQIFIGQKVGFLGNAATNVVYPFTVIALALALLIGDGASALFNLSLGKKDNESTSKSVGSLKARKKIEKINKDRKKIIIIILIKNGMI